MPDSLLHPLVLCFLAGALAGLFKAGPRLPAPVADFISFYLLLAIGLKGGVQLSQAVEFAWALPLAVGIGLSLATTLIAFALLVWLVGLGRDDASAVAAHYGSVSAVTFAVAVGYLTALGLQYEPYLPILLAVLEMPGIAMAILLSQMVCRPGGHSCRSLLKELLLGKSIFLLGAGMAIGWVIGPSGFAPLKPWFVDIFPGVLCLFILDLGVVAAERFRELKTVGIRLALFALALPLLAGATAAYVGVGIGLSPGGATVFAALIASASYIAAPAATRMAIPQANPTYSLFAALGVTFPVNVTLGIPIYLALAQRFSS